MPRGAPRILVDRFYRNWPIETIVRLPDGLRGLYVLYDTDGRPLRIGISGRGDQDVKRRIYNNYHLLKTWRGVDHFSVFTFTTPTWFEQVERLMLRAVGTALAGNLNAGEVRVKSGVSGPPSMRGVPDAFVRRKVDDDGYVFVGEKHAGRSARVEIGVRKG
jgi:hypothetical protein